MDGEIIPSQIYEDPTKKERRGSDENELPQIEGLQYGETIGQGAFGLVKSASIMTDQSNPIVVAVKFINLVQCKQQGITEKFITREVVLHSECSKHPNILKLIDCNIERDYLWIILEMADGGDLFDKIEPDVGVDNDVAQFYFQQLTNAISYLHLECGIAHRDIKPENILLDMNGNLKLADFGLASKFKRKDGTLRKFNDTVGSPPYMAPEIFNSSSSTKYLANLTDIWSIGIFIFVLLTGEIPWQQPIKNDYHFNEFINNHGKLNIGPWLRIELRHLNLLRKLLQDDPKQRLTINDLKKHPWYVKQNKFANSKGLCKNPHALAKALMSNLKISLTTETYDTFMSQDPMFGENRWDNNNDNIHNNRTRLDNIFTQPLQNDIADLEHRRPQTADRDTLATNNIDDVYFNTQRPFTQHTTTYSNKPIMNQMEKKWLEYISNDVAILQFITDENEFSHTQISESKNIGEKFKPFNLTKFFSLESMEDILTLLENSLRISRINVKPDLPGSYLEVVKTFDNEKDAFPLKINIKTKDRRGSSLNGTITINLITPQLKVLEFQRKTGDPLEWRRLFKKIALLCKEIILIPQ